MNIVFVSQALPYLPAQDGFRLYAANLLRSLSRRHQIDLISLMEEGDSNHLAWAREYCATVTPIPLAGGSNWLKPLNLVATYAWGKPLRHRNRFASLLQGGCSSRQWDVVHVEGGYAGGLIPSRLPLPRILSVHDSWKLRCAQMAACSSDRRERLHYSILKRIEPRYENLVYSRFDACVVVGETDACAIREVSPRSHTAVIPNGIDTGYYSPLSARDEGSSFVFHGNLEYAPNIQAAMEFARVILPIIKRGAPQAAFRIIGAKPAKEIRNIAGWPGIKLFADLPDLRSALGSARVYVCPLRFGTGVKNKLLEAMAMGLPIIAYPQAMNGIDCIPGRHWLRADDPQAFARLALDLLQNPERGEEIGRAARRHVEENFSWDSRALSFEGLYRRAIERWGARETVPYPTSQAMANQALVTTEEIHSVVRDA